ncbi:MAG: hypothetical protein NC132_02475 [Corallococcus sp.]|nr:hypothetical protein [Corallococcus sp.]MCM1358974.1 hypothetical protein [Corallococcus sp.]MCM1394963.1 hypothetical protein [Corallococcus sp.]
MVGKLIKHELRSTMRVAVVPAIIMVLFAVLARIMIETTNTGLMIMVIMFYAFSVMATLLVGYFFGIGSFYRSLFTGNGYLTLSLPVTADQLIWSKLISAITVMFASIVVCILSSCIFLLGAFEDVVFVLKDIFTSLGETIGDFASNEPLFFVETALCAIISVPMSFLVFYAVMSLGQLFTVKNRKLISVLLYVGLIFLWSVLNTTIIADINYKMTEISIHLTMWVQIVFYAGVNVGCYFLVRYIIRNKINLLA